MSPENKLFSPFELTHVLALTSIQPFDNCFITVYGKYIDKKKEPSFGKYYDWLEDETRGYRLTILVPENIKTQLKSGTSYEFEGVLVRKTNDSNNELNIYLRFDVTRVVSEKTAPVDIKLQEKLSLIQKRDIKPRIDIDNLLSELLANQNKPRIALIGGRTAITLNDISSSLNYRRNTYSFQNINISLANKSEIIETLKQADKKEDIDLIVLYRGGGSGLEIFDDLDIVRTVLELRKPFVTAIGHVDDQQFIQTVADRAFGTPSAFGTYLKEFTEKFFELEDTKKRLLDKEISSTAESKESKAQFAVLKLELDRKISEFGQLQTQLNKINEEKIVFQPNENLTPRQILSFGLVILLVIGGILVGAGSIAAYRYIFSEEAQPAAKQSANDLPTNTVTEPSNTNSQPVLNRRNKRPK